MFMALPLSSCSRQTKPSIASARAFTRATLSTNSAMRGSSSGYLIRAMLNWARWRAVLMPSLRCLGVERFGIAHAEILLVGIARIFVDAPFDFGTEMPQQALHRPGGAVAEGADGVALDLGRDLHQHVDLALLRAAFRHAGEHAPHPAHALAARRALAAALVLVEIRDARHRADDVGGLVHHDDA